MKLVFVSPYASASQESGAIFMLANYLRQSAEATSANELVYLKCNGVVSVCDRDGDRSWKRGIHSCSSCMRDQTHLAEWAGTPSQDLSHFISSDDFVAQNREILMLPTAELLSYQFKGARLWELSAATFFSRFGVTAPDLKNKLHEQVLRKFYMGLARLMTAASKFNTWYLPDLLVIAGGNDLITAPILAQAINQRRDYARLEWSLHERCIVVHRSLDDRQFRCELLVDGLSAMRSDSRTWPGELLKILEDLCEFLGVYKEQVPLQVAQ